ncbi:hypothetical protein V2J09_011556 [Rumex salicifolius]
MYSNADNQDSQSQSSYKGRGRSGQARGKGRGRDRGVVKLQEAQEDESNDTLEADTLLMNEVTYLHERHVLLADFETAGDTDQVWYLDNGASNHMTKNLSYFVSIDRSISGKVRFGDDSRIDIKGKGTIALLNTDDKKKFLKDVYYIPDLRSNI